MNSHRTMRLLAPYFLVALLVTLPSIALSQSGDFKSELQPNKTYVTTQIQTIEGYDGAQDIAPLTNARQYKIVTEKESGGIFHATLSVYPLANGTKPNITKPETVVEFDVTTSGSLKNFNQITGEGTVAANVAAIIAAQHLEGILLNPRYALERKITRTYKTKSSDVSGTKVKIAFTWDEKSATPVESPNMTTTRTGSGTFDTGLRIYTQSETVKTSEILVPDDALGPGKQIKMMTKVQHTTKVTSNK